MKALTLGGGQSLPALKHVMMTRPPSAKTTGWDLSRVAVRIVKQFEACFHMPAKLDDPFDKGTGIRVSLTPDGYEPGQVAVAHQVKVEVQAFYGRRDSVRVHRLKGYRTVVAEEVEVYTGAFRH